MNNLALNKKTWLIIGGLVLLLIVGLIFYFTNKKSEPMQKPLEVSKKEVGLATIPAGLPQNLPSEVGSKVLQNYESRTNDKRLQSTRVVTSKKPAREALEVYIAFFKTLGYEGGFVESSSTPDGQQFAQMKKDKNQLVIVASPDVAGPKQSTVELTLNQPSQ